MPINKSTYLKLKIDNIIAFWKLLTSLGHRCELRALRRLLRDHYGQQSAGNQLLPGTSSYSVELTAPPIKTSAKWKLTRSLRSSMDFVDYETLALTSLKMPTIGRILPAKSKSVCMMTDINFENNCMQLYNQQVV